MKYIDFYQKFKNSYPILNHQDVDKIAGTKILNTQLSDWVKKKLLIKPRRGIYLLKENENIDRFLLANKLYEPSCVSLESALFYYGLIPDVVAAVTSVSTKKTRKFEFKNQLFIYQKIKNNLFFGYREIAIDKWGFLIAVPEKAILDYFYLNLPRLKTKDSWDELRVDSSIYIKEINKARLLRLSKIFNSEKLEKKIRIKI